jgi:hypothetical protein
MFPSAVELIQLATIFGRNRDVLTVEAWQSRSHAADSVIVTVGDIKRAVGTNGYTFRV